MIYFETELFIMKNIIDDFYDKVEYKVRVWIADGMREIWNYSKRNWYSMAENYVEDGYDTPELFEETLESEVYDCDDEYIEKLASALNVQLSGDDIYDDVYNYIKNTYYTEWLNKCVESVKYHMERELNDEY